MMRKIVSVVMVIALLFYSAAPVLAELPNSGAVQKSRSVIFQSVRTFSSKLHPVGFYASSNQVNFRLVPRNSPPILFQQSGQAFSSGSYVEGKSEGLRVGRESASPFWLVGGLFTGIITFIPSIFAGLEPPASKLPVDKPQDYRVGFAEGYRNGKRGRQMSYAGIGWAIWIGILVGVAASK